MYAAKVIADSKDAIHGTRLTTMEVTLPRFVLAEFNTHRKFSRNSASSRAIPVEKRIKAVRENPFTPEAFGANKKGMQAGDDVSPLKQWLARRLHLFAAWMMCLVAQGFVKLGVHKQWANRYIEFFSWTTIIVSSTEWENFFNLRISKLAQPEIRVAAILMRDAYRASTPQILKRGEWHLPYVQPDELVSLIPTADLVKISAGRCARVSYLTQAGLRETREDVRLYTDLVGNFHMSPTEHPARVGNGPPEVFSGNFRGPWIQHRKELPNEDVKPKEENEWN